MINIDELKQEQQMEREMEHKARLKRQRKRKIIIAIAAFVIVALIPLFLIIGAKIEANVRHSMKEKEMEPEIKKFPTGGVIIDEESVYEHNEELKKTPSDIDGMTQYDKIQAGLKAYDDSDTDKDGLTDREEIEIYGSDPLKCSTAGDLYSDGFKVENGLDVQKKYDYEGNDDIVTSEDGVVTIYAKTPFDVNGAVVSPKDKYNISWSTSGMSIKDSTESIREAMEGNPEAFHIHYYVADTFYKAYTVNNYDGDTIEIDLEAFADNEDLDADDLDVEAYSKQPEDELTVKSKGDMRIVTINRDGETEGESFKSFLIYIVKKEKINPFSINTVRPQGDNYVKGSIKDKYDATHGLIVICPPATVFLHTPPKIYCSEDASDEEKRVLLDQATKVYQSIFYEPIWVTRPVCDESYITYTSSSSIRKMTKLYDLFLGKRNNLAVVGTADPDGRVSLLMYEGLGDFYEQTKAAEETALREKAEEMAGFSLSDEFNFANFDSIYSGCGVCMGFARIAAEVYNDNSVQNPIGSVTDNTHLPKTTENTISYDITELEECQTFFDRFLNDYNTELNPLIAEDDEVIRMMTCYWADGNEKMYANNDWESFFINQEEGEYLSWRTIEEAMSHMSNHKALICCLCIGNTIEGGHAINLVGYTRYGKATIEKEGLEMDVDEIVVFDTYDSNCPQSIGALYCYKCRLSNSNDDVVLYEYLPIAGYEVAQNYRSQFLGNSADTLTPGEEKTVMLNIMTDDMKSMNIKQWYHN